MGAHLKSVILTRNLPEAAPITGFLLPLVLLLHRVPQGHLDHLQVPLDTPPFADLPDETREAIVDSLENQEDAHIENVIRLGFILEGAQRADALDLRCPNRLQARVARADELRQQFIAMVRVTQDPPQRRRRVAFYPRAGAPEGDMHIKILAEGECGAEIGEILRVPAPGPPAPVIKDLLADLTLLSDLIVGNGNGEGLIMLPRCMIVDNIYTNRTQNNIAAAGAAGPSAAHEAGPSAAHQEVASPPARRQFTYGRYKCFFLFDEN